MYEVEYLQGIMVASSAFITIAGIIFTVSASQKALRKWYLLTPLLFSIALGAASTITALMWFNTPSDPGKVRALWLLYIQFILWFLPTAYALGWSTRKSFN